MPNERRKFARGRIGVSRAKSPKKGRRIVGELGSEPKPKAPKRKEPGKTSDDDTGYLWGKAGRAKAERDMEPKGYEMWEREK